MWLVTMTAQERASSPGQTAPPELYAEIMAMDTILFERGFNDCDLEAVDAILIEDFEFYHDQNGVQDKQTFLSAFRESICSNPDRKPIREPVENSTEIYPLYNDWELYGALQMGSHEFFIKEPGEELYKTNIAEFTHLWMLQDEQWFLKRSLSYNHREP